MLAGYVNIILMFWVYLNLLFSCFFCFVFLNLNEDFIFGHSNTQTAHNLNATKYKVCCFNTVYVWTVYISFLLNMFGVYLNLFR